jgi:catechol 2,3-dioxygenase-like lactoylglutathione lyase family enzyme
LGVKTVWIANALGYNFWECRMIDHVTIFVADFEAAKVFYAGALAPLGYEILRDYPVGHPTRGPMTGFGAGGKPDFWIAPGGPVRPRLHIAFAAANRAAVDAFHAAALAAGATDNGAPGLRPIYHVGYYGAFVIDLEGHNLEAVCHRPK